jgi:hypothetical protein
VPRLGGEKAGLSERVVSRASLRGCLCHKERPPCPLEGSWIGPHAGWDGMLGEQEAPRVWEHGERPLALWKEAGLAPTPVGMGCSENRKLSVCGNMGRDPLPFGRKLNWPSRRLGWDARRTGSSPFVGAWGETPCPLEGSWIGPHAGWGGMLGEQEDPVAVWKEEGLASTEPALRSSETSVLTRATRRNIQEDGIPQIL